MQALHQASHLAADGAQGDAEALARHLVAQPRRQQLQQLALTSDGESTSTFQADFDGPSRTGLWSFTGTGSGFNAPVKKWESTSSWNRFRSDLA